MEYFNLVCCLSCVLLLALLALAKWHTNRVNRSWWTRKTMSVVCRQCMGTGWIDRTERTMNFVGDGFADVNHPARMCATCGGTGQLIR